MKTPIVAIIAALGGGLIGYSVGQRQGPAPTHAAVEKPQPTDVRGFDYLGINRLTEDVERYKRDLNEHLCKYHKEAGYTCMEFSSGNMELIAAPTDPK